MKYLVATVTACVCITAVLCYAVSLGIDGMVLSGGLLILGGLGGYNARLAKESLSGRRER